MNIRKLYITELGNKTVTNVNIQVGQKVIWTNIKVVQYKIKGHKCYCGFSARYKSKLNEHKKSGHDGIEDPQCDQCTYLASKRGNLDKHYQINDHKYKQRDYRLQQVQKVV